MGGECGGEVDRARRLRLAQPAGAQQSGMAAAAQGGRRANNQGKNRANSRPGACAQPPRAAAPPHARPGSSSSKETAPALAAVRCAMPQPPVARPPCRRPQRPPAPPGGPCSCRGWGESRMAGTRVGKEVTWSIPPKGLANDCAPQPCRQPQPQAHAEQAKARQQPHLRATLSNRRSISGATRVKACDLSGVCVGGRGRGWRHGEGQRSATAGAADVAGSMACRACRPSGSHPGQAG